MSGIYRKSYLISRFCQDKLILDSLKIANNHVHEEAKMGKIAIYSVFKKKCEIECYYYKP